MVGIASMAAKFRNDFLKTISLTSILEKRKFEEDKSKIDQIVVDVMVEENEKDRGALLLELNSASTTLLQGIHQYLKEKYEIILAVSEDISPYLLNKKIKFYSGGGLGTHGEILKGILLYINIFDFILIYNKI